MIIILIFIKGCNILYKRQKCANLDRSVFLEPGDLLEKQVNASENGDIPRHLHVVPDHGYEEGRLAAVQVVATVPIGHEAVLPDQVEIVLDNAAGRGEGSCAQERLHDPVGVPVVDLLQTNTFFQKSYFPFDAKLFVSLSLNL